MSEGCSIADRAAPASQQVTSYSPYTALQDQPVRVGGGQEGIQRENEERNCHRKEMGAICASPVAEVLKFERI